ncbi:isoaspartyl peptidase/L-asparaginase [Nannocystis pusilla]|uniref:Isoaspartyl peptidase/L-asparaginase n=1 Tax=Nannocystis pusilla TaxID=889268 RepID=A0ABS7TTB3_9BACT|nr:isoaspartyl peptidase/L-asparaginase [Nannocystis pusilla]
MQLRPFLALAAVLACGAPSAPQDSSRTPPEGPTAPVPTDSSHVRADTSNPPVPADSSPDPKDSPPARALPVQDGADAPTGPLVVTHAGVGTALADADGAERAAAAGRDVLASGGDALDAAIAAAVVLEDDPRYNAGTGANIRLDGRTIQLDAALMTDDGRFAAVAAIERVKNPIRAARLVLDSPHVLLVGEGATRFAHKLGLPDEVPRSSQAEAKYRARMQRLRELVEAPGTAEPDWRLYWNYPGEMPPDMVAWRHGGDTVGAVARTADQRFAATLSTGGTSVTLYGRVGDVPIYGAGLFAGPAGAVACTGHGEEIIREALARTVYQALAAGTPAREAVRRAAAAFDPRWDVGLIAVDRGGWGVAATQPMASGHAS